MGTTASGGPTTDTSALHSSTDTVPVGGNTVGSVVPGIPLCALPPVPFEPLDISVIRTSEQVPGRWGGSPSPGLEGALLVGAGVTPTEIGNVGQVGPFLVTLAYNYFPVLATGKEDAFSDSTVALLVRGCPWGPRFGCYNVSL